VREFLRARREQEAYLGIFPQCKNLLRTLPRLTFDPIKAEDVALNPHELTHAPDALRYGLSSLPFLPGQEKEENGVKWDPVREFFGKETSCHSYLGFLKR